MKSANHRGHRIIEVGDDWLYADTRQPVSENLDRPCGLCGKANTPEGHDACLGTLPGVMNACCGHGHGPAYVQLVDGTSFHGTVTTREGVELPAPEKERDQEADNQQMDHR